MKIPFICGECEDGWVQETEGSYEVTFRRNQYSIPNVRYLKCEQCGAISFTPEQDSELERRTVSAARLAEGLLPPEDIVGLREFLGISQVDLETILGTGQKHVVRWESGAVFQSRANDERLRLIGIVAKALALPDTMSRSELVEALSDIPSVVARLAEACAAHERGAGSTVWAPPQDKVESQAREWFWVEPVSDRLDSCDEGEHEYALAS